MSKIAEEVEKFLTPIVGNLGCEIVEVEFVHKHDGDNLTVFIDKKGGVTIDDCERVHKAIDEPLDELNPTNDKPYTLNVSSPGIDRPIITDKDYTRNLGELLEVRLFQAIQKKKIYIGNLMEFNSETIKLDTGDEIVSIDRKLISKATKYIEI